ncbi:MAG: hypothetical protein ACOH1E_05920 [Brevundimonas sp.]
MTNAVRRPSMPLPILIRQSHLFVGMIIAPSVLLFAITGGLQIFRLQESHEGYTPPPIVEKLGRMHMDQVFALKKRKAGPPPVAAAAAAAAVAPPAPEPKPAPPLSKVMLQWFSAFVAAGLTLSTLAGVWMGVTLGRQRVAARWTLLAGTLIPLLMLLIPG